MENVYRNVHDEHVIRDFDAESWADRSPWTEGRNDVLFQNNPDIRHVEDIQSRADSTEANILCLMYYTDGRGPT